MAQPADAPTNRQERRRARTRLALVRAAQSFVAAGNRNAPILEITQLADVGLGSFYNHFENKEELFRTAVEEALDTLGALIDDLTIGIEDPAVVFAQSFRLVGRWHRRNRELSRVLVGSGLAVEGSTRGLAPRARRDIEDGVRAGRFTVRDPDLATTIVVGAALGLVRFVDDHPQCDDGESADQVTEHLLRMLGVAKGEAQRICRVPLPAVEDTAA
jgi:AcrR family transcriptional regulator